MILIAADPSIYHGPTYTLPLLWPWHV